MGLQPGTIFAKKYRIVRLLEEGGMGAVYEAEQVKIGRPVALKTMLPELVASAEHRRRFEQEARASARFESDYVVKVYDHDIDEASGTPWIEMELLRGENLGALVARRGVLTPGEVAAVFEDVGKGLGPAHDVGVIHLDLKPENLFVARLQDRTVIKVLDFGIAKIAAEQRKSAQVTTLIASPMFLAPEQAKRNARITPATDVWALGLIAFHLLTGRFYWRNANLAPGEVFHQGAQFELLMEIGTSTLEPASQRARSLGGIAVPPGFDAWFARCVARDLEARYPTAAAAVAALREVLGPAARIPDPGSIAPPAPRPPTPQPPPAAPRPDLPLTRPTDLPVASTVPMAPAPQAPVAETAFVQRVGRGAGGGVSRAPLAAGVGAALALAAGGFFLVTRGGRTAPAATTPAATATPAVLVNPVTPAPAPPAPPVTPDCDVPRPDETFEQFTRRCSAPASENAFVRLPEGGLAVQEHEVTRGEYGAWLQRAMPARPAPAGPQELPVVGVTRAEAAAYCAAQGSARLPTRAEWRQALGRDARWTAGITPTPALAAGGSSPRDERSLGDRGSLYDLAGNVNEWTSDGTDDAPYAMGAFFGEARDTVAGYLRDGTIEQGATDHTGFRCVRTTAAAARPVRPAASPRRPTAGGAGGDDLGDLGL